MAKARESVANSPLSEYNNSSLPNLKASFSPARNSTIHTLGYLPLFPLRSRKPLRITRIVDPS